MFAQSIDLDKNFPLGMEYEDWLKKAMEIDHITDEQLAQDAAKAAEGHEAQLKAEQEARDKKAAEQAAEKAAEKAAETTAGQSDHKH